MSARVFFKEQREQSFIKSEIVSKYFDAWAGVIAATQSRSPFMTQKIAYIDLFAVPGRYADGSNSTPLKIIEKAIAKDSYCERLVCWFNDKDENNSRSLEEAIQRLPGFQKLKHKPKVFNQEIGTEIVNKFEKMKPIPTLFFIDPWGYKGLSLRLINSVLKNWGCDCIFFFNYNRINMGMNNINVKAHIESLFGKERANDIRKELSNNYSAAKREQLIIGQLCAALKAMGGKFTLPFRFKTSKGKRTSHHLIFVSKNFKGYDIMKGVMARESSSHEDGFPSFEYNPGDKIGLKQGRLLKMTRSVEALAGSLLLCFAGRKIKMNDIYMEHSVDTYYIKRNYKDALQKLESEGKIAAGKHRKNTFGDNVVVEFFSR